MRAKERSMDDAYYIGVETSIEGVGPALKLTGQTYATREEAEQALGEVLKEHSDARICDWSDLFDIDNPIEVIWPEVTKAPDSAPKQESRVSANLRVDPEELAHQAISKILERAVPGKIPESIFEILHKNWLPYMAECFIKHGAGSQQWSSVTQAFFHFTNATLGRLNFKYIKKEYGSLEEFNKKLACEMSQSELGVLMQRHDLKPLKEWLSSVAKPGTWFEIYVGDNKARRILKLSSINDGTGQLKFSDRTGKHALEIDMYSFLEDLQASRSTIIQGEGHFDSALTHIIDNNRKSVEKNLEV